MNLPQNTQGALPAYLRISETIAREISAGRLLDGARLPPERAMAQDYGVAIGTLRKALADLATKGLLTRRQGSGNYIQHRAQPDNIYAFFRLELLDGGGLPTAQTLSIRHMAKDGDLPEFGIATNAFRFRRLRFLDGDPVALEEIWLDGSCAKRIASDAVSESLYHFYKTQLGIWISRAQDRISVGIVPHWRVEQFEMTRGAPCGFIERIAWDQQGRKIETSRTWFDPTRATYVSRM